MKPSSSSKNPKKISDEYRSKKKKIKSKSNKRHRRRDSSISSFSSSDSEEISRSRRKSSKSKSSVGKRKRESKKSERKSFRKKKRAHSDSSVSDSSSGSSESERSRSLVRKSKIRKRERVRGRKSSHLYEATRGRNRNRSRSCSTCSGGSRSGSISGGWSRSPIEERFEHRQKRSASIEERLESIRDQSPIEERFGSSCGRSPFDERFESSGWRPVDGRFESICGQSPINERLGSNCRRSPIEERFEASQCRSLIEDRYGSTRMLSPIVERFSSSQMLSPIDERFGSGRGLSPIDKRFESDRVRSSIDDRFKSGHVQSPVEERFENHGRSCMDGRFESNHGRSPMEDRDWEKGGTKRLRSVLVITKSADEGGNILKAYDEYPSCRSNEYYDEGNDKMGLNIDGKEKNPYDARFREEVISSNDRREDEGKEAEVLESILRQKALENFKKFRCRNPTKLESLRDKKGETTLGSFQDSQNLVRTSELECKSPKPMDNQRHVQGGAHSTKLKAVSVPDVLVENADGNSVQLFSNAQNSPNRLKRVQEPSDKISQGETSLAKDNQDNRVAQHASDKVGGAEVDAADIPAPGVCNKEKENCKSDESTVDSASGSQFEQKTFSRMHDGELVQVSYKVYIPKKTPALGRRQIRR